MSLLINCMSSWAVVIKCQIHQSFVPNIPQMDFYWLISYAQVFLVCWRIQLFFQIFLLQIVECKQKAIDSTPAWEEKGLSLFCCNSEAFGNSNMECSAVQDHMEMGMIANILGSSLFFCSSVFWCACYPFIAQCLVTCKIPAPHRSQYQIPWFSWSKSYICSFHCLLERSSSSCSSNLYWENYWMQSWKHKFQHHLNRKELVFFIVNCCCFEWNLNCVHVCVCVCVGAVRIHMEWDCKHQGAGKV